MKSKFISVKQAVSLVDNYNVIVGVFCKWAKQ
jgi:hypothetical protein